MKKDEHVLTGSKIVTSMSWFEKNQGIEKIYSDMETLVTEFLAKWHAENPEPAGSPDIMLNESEVMNKIAEKYK